MVSPSDILKSCKSGGSMSFDELILGPQATSVLEAEDEDEREKKRTVRKWEIEKKI